MPSPSANRLPIRHPEYLYTDSKNPYWRKLHDFSGRVFFDRGTEEHAGHWRERFPAPPSELHVEIGCNAGHVALELAARNPGRGYIGIDWKFKPIFWGIEKALKRGIPNLLFFRAHAERLTYMFDKAEVDQLNLFFPDPWPRKKQLKNRYVTARAFADAAAVVREGGCFWIKTDHAGYFEWMLAALAQCERDSGRLWKIEEETRDLHAGCADPGKLEIPEVTLFEKLFIKDGIKINSLRLSRTAL